MIHTKTYYTISYCTVHCTTTTLLLKKFPLLIHRGFFLIRENEVAKFFGPFCYLLSYAKERIGTSQSYIPQHAHTNF